MSSERMMRAKKELAAGHQKALLVPHSAFFAAGELRR
jgi:hypothetical protein